MQRAFSLVEVIVAAGILTLLSTSIMAVYMTTHTLDRHSSEQLTLLNEAQNGLEMVRSIRAGSFDELTPGTYGLEDTGSEWSLNNDTAYGELTREVVITAEDTDTRRIAVTVSSDTQSTTLVHTLTNWQQELVLGGFEMNVSTASVGGTGNRNIEGIVFQNTSGTDITLSTLILSWTKQQASRRLIAVSIDGVEVWDSVAGVDSGTSVSIPATISAGTHVDVVFTFTLPMTNRDFTIEVEDTTGAVTSAQFET